MAVSTEAHHVTGQVFSGRFVAGDGDVAPASFAVDADQVVITGPEGKSHRWSVHEIVVTAVSSPRFQFDIAGEKAVFEADSPSRFLFEFLPSVQAARQRYAPPATAQAAAPGDAGGHAGPTPAVPAIETAPTAVETLVTETQDNAEEATATPPIDTGGDEADLVIDLRPRERPQPPTPTHGRSLSDTIRRHKEQAANRAVPPRPVDEPAPPRAEDGPAGSPSTAETAVGTPAPHPEVQLREPWDTITPKLASRAASVEAPSAGSPTAAAPEGVQSPASAPAEAAKDDQGEASGRSGTDLSEPSEGGEPAPATSAPGEEPVVPDVPPERPRPSRPGQATSRTGLGDLVKAARGDGTESPSVTTGDLSDLRAPDRRASGIDAGPSTVLDQLRRRWRSLRRDRPDPTPQLDGVTPERGPEPESSTDLTAGMDVTADAEKDPAGTANSGLSADTGSRAAERVAPEHATPRSATEGLSRDGESETVPNAHADEPVTGACVHEWDSSLPPGAVTRICLLCKVVEAIPAEPELQPRPPDDASESQPASADHEPPGGSRPSARSELLRQAAARRRAYRNRWSG